MHFLCHSLDISLWKFCKKCKNQPNIFLHKCHHCRFLSNEAWLQNIAHAIQPHTLSLSWTLDFTENSSQPLLLNFSHCPDESVSFACKLLMADYTTLYTTDKQKPAEIVALLHRCRTERHALGVWDTWASSVSIVFIYIWLNCEDEIVFHE